MDVDPETLMDLAESLLRSVPRVLSAPRHGERVAGLTAGTATAAVLHHRERRRARVLPPKAETRGARERLDVPAKALTFPIPDLGSAITKTGRAGLIMPRVWHTWPDSAGVHLSSISNGLEISRCTGRDGFDRE